MTGHRSAAKSLAGVRAKVAEAVAAADGPFAKAVAEALTWALLWPAHLDYLERFVGAPYGPWRVDVAAMRPKLKGLLTGPPPTNRAQRRAARRTR